MIIKNTEGGRFSTPIYNTSTGLPDSFDSAPSIYITGEHSDTPLEFGVDTGLTITEDMTRDGGAVAQTGVFHLGIDWATADSNFFVDRRHYQIHVNTGAVAGVDWSGRLVREFQLLDIATVDQLAVIMPSMRVDMNGQTADKISIGHWLKNGTVDAGIVPTAVTVSVWRGGAFGVSFAAIVTDAAMSEFGSSGAYVFELLGGSRIAVNEYMIVEGKATISGVDYPFKDCYAKN